MEKIEKRYGIIFLKDVDEKKIIDLFNHDIIEEIDDDKYWRYIGLYYGKKIEKDYDLMKKYYLMAIDKGNDDAMYNLGHYYQFKEKNYDLMKKYYLMAIDKENSYAMNNLGHYYQFKEIEKNYDLMKKYYLMAIDKENSYAMNNLGHYYQFKEKNYDLMKKYYLRAIYKGNINAMNNLGYYYRRNKLLHDDIIIVVKHNIKDINLNIKILLENKFIIDNYQYLIKYIDTNRYYSLINLIYCN
jgi:TPR repeat protein